MRCAWKRPLFWPCRSDGSAGSEQTGAPVSRRAGPAGIGLTDSTGGGAELYAAGCAVITGNPMRKTLKIRRSAGQRVFQGRRAWKMPQRIRSLRHAATHSGMFSRRPRT
ncbi:hypothetical protein GCM10010315_57140 [Streptomyces luteosporeus]|uniref:Uncharacterized protein n=1 Tax=Streptomyces luteosporeus TaxID=173856 RepID=A0ABN3U6T2_9ACTN